MKIHGDINSGNCLKVKWVCDRLALPYTWIDVDVMKRESRTAQFLQTQQRRPGSDRASADGRPLAQSNAIILHLAAGWT